MTWWIEGLANDGRYMAIVAWIFWVILSITLHELAHGWTAIWQGDKTPIFTGHMTANPIIHMGPMSFVMLALCGIAWGAMPVDPSRFRDRKGDVYVAAAGPAMNLLIALVCLILLSCWLKFVPEGKIWGNGAIFLYYGVALNLILAPLNLLPIPPLDGSRILAGFSWKARELFSRPDAQMIGMFLFLAVFFMTPIGGILIGKTWQGVDALIDGIGGVVGNQAIDYAMSFGRG